jgi:23S rRNA (adenine1618-N6)-methyltransferase
LERVEAIEVKTIPMGQGNKSGRIVAWTFFTPEDKREWVNTRWNEITLFDERD